MLTKAQKQEYYAILDASDLPASKKREAVREISKPSATPQSVGSIIGIGSGILAGGRFLHKREHEYNSRTPNWAQELEPVRDGKSITDDDSAWRNDDGSMKRRVPNDGDGDAPDDGTATVTRPDPDPDASLPDREVIDGIPVTDYPITTPVDRDHDFDGDGQLDYEGNPSKGGFPSFSDLIQSLISKWTDATVTGGEEIRNQWDLDKMDASNEFSAQQAEISRDWQEQMYQKYNSLSGKIAQAEEAGVNPMFAMTGGVTPSGFSSASPSGSVASGSGSPTGSGSGIAGLLSAIAGIFKIKSDISLANSQAKKNEAEAETIDATRPLTLQQMAADIRKTDSGTQLNLQRVIESFTSIEKLRADLNLSNKQAEAVASQISFLEAQTNYLNLTGPQDVRIKKASASVAEWQEKNKEEFKALDISMDVVDMIFDIGLGIVGAKTGLKLIGNIGGK